MSADGHCSMHEGRNSVTNMLTIKLNAMKNMTISWHKERIWLSVLNARTNVYYDQQHSEYIFIIPLFVRWYCSHKHIHNLIHYLRGGLICVHKISLTPPRFIIQMALGWDMYISIAVLLFITGLYTVLGKYTHFYIDCIIWRAWRDIWHKMKNKACHTRKSEWVIVV
jgi:hypothetical protein